MSEGYKNPLLRVISVSISLCCLLSLNFLLSGTAGSVQAAAPAAPPRFTSHVIFSGSGHPDDLAFDTKGNLLFSDLDTGTVEQVQTSSTSSPILSGIQGPEGIVVRPDGTIILSEQLTNRILLFPPGATTGQVLRSLPGTSGSGCQLGIDSIAFDPTTGTLIIPDSPIGTVFRMSLDGSTLTQLATGIARPVGAGIDSRGNVFVPDECGGLVWKITPGGTITRLTGFSSPDDVAFDSLGRMFVIDLGNPHALFLVNPTTGRKTVISNAFSQPQGLLIDAHNDVFVSDETAQTITEFIPA